MRCKNLGEYLKRTGKTEQQLADELGISQSFVNMLKRGKRRPDPQLAAKIEQLTGIPFRKLLLEDGTAA